MKLTVESLMTEYGYSRASAEQEVKRAYCEHEYGDRCESGFAGCFRTCQKCGQMMVLGGHCWELKKKREALTRSDTDSVQQESKQDTSPDEPQK